MNKSDWKHYGPHICKKFGCGRPLTITEKLFGNHCINHQQMKKNTLTVIEALQPGDVFQVESSGLIYTKVHLTTVRRNRHLFTQFAQREGRQPRPFKVGTIVIFLTNKQQTNEEKQTCNAGPAAARRDFQPGKGRRKL